MAQRFWPLKRGTFALSSGFGPRAGGFHAGLDFAAKDGTPFYACQAGTVLHIGPADGYGQWIVLDHDDSQGSGVTEYGHMWNAFATGLRVGSKVKAGQLLGYVGSNGQSTGPHLHLAVMPYAYDPAKKIDPAPWLKSAGYVGETPAPAPKPSGGTVQNPITRTQISPNKHSGGRNVSWVVIHTQQANSTAAGLVNYCCNPASEVSYNGVVDDEETVLVVPWDQNPWSAANANTRGDHICLAGSFAEWDRGRWLSTDARDGLNEDMMLTRAAALTAWRCTVRGIPIEYVGGNGIPNRNGICGHRDFGTWGGGHTDPGPNFPWDELIRRAKVIANSGEDWLAMASLQEVEALIYKCLQTYVGPIGSDVKDLRWQAVGSRDFVPGDDKASYPGHEFFGGRTLDDAVAAIGVHLNIPGFLDPKAGK